MAGSSVRAHRSGGAQLCGVTGTGPANAGSAAAPAWAERWRQSPPAPEKVVARTDGRCQGRSRWAPSFSLFSSVRGVREHGGWPQAAVLTGVLWLVVPGGKGTRCLAERIGIQVSCGNALSAAALLPSDDF